VDNSVKYNCQFNSKEASNLIQKRPVKLFKEWLDSFRSESTKRVYKAGVKNFLKVVGLHNADQYIAEVKNGRDFFSDLLNYAKYMSENNYPPKTAGAYSQAIINFIEYELDIELSKKQRRKLNNALPKGKRARTIEDDLTRDVLRKILTHCDTKGKALFLFLVSSGIRIGEALKLELDDINLKSDPVKVKVRGEYTKTGEPYYSFISREAKDALLEWLKIRQDYILSAKNRGRGLSKLGYGKGLKSVEDKRIFPFSQAVAQQMWNNALRKAGLENHDKVTKRRTLHIHMLRKYFLSKLKLVIPKEIAEALAGHEEGLDEAYRRYTKEEIRDWYKKAEPYLYVFVPQEITEIQTTFQAQLQDLKEKVTDLLYQNQKLFIQKDELRQELEKVKARLARWEKFEEKLKQLEEWTPPTPEDLERMITQILQKLKGKVNNE